MGMLKIEEKKVCEARKYAKEIANQVKSFIADKSTVAIERTVLRLMGVDGVDREGIPYPNLVVDRIQSLGYLEDGVAPWLIRTMLAYNLTAQQAAEKMVSDRIDWFLLQSVTMKEIKELGREIISNGLDLIQKQKEERAKRINRLGEGDKPYIYVIVATGDIYADVVQAKAAARQGADIIAVIRSTAQSLLDYVPYGATQEGFGGTYATQENFRIMRRALDEVGEELDRYIRLCNYSSGLCMPEIAVMGAIERLDVMLNDALYGILFRDINMQRTLIDQHFSRMILSYAGIIINTGEDNYLTTADAVQAAHTVLASQFINEQLAYVSGLPSELMGLGHAFEINPALTNGFLYELAQAQLSRQVFPQAPLKYMPPTKFMTGNIFRGYIQNALFNFVGMLTKQGIQLLGMMTEAMHTPHIHDRMLAIENAKYVMNNIKDLAEEIEFKPDGIVNKRANEVLFKATELLKEIAENGLFNAIENGIFADVKRAFTGGKGLNGVFRKSEYYYNPLEEELIKRLKLRGESNGD